MLRKREGRVRSCIPFTLIILAVFAGVSVSAGVASSPLQADSSNPSTQDNPLASSAHPVNRTRGTSTSGFWNDTHGLGLLPSTSPVSKGAVKGAALLGVPNSFSWNGYFRQQSYMTSVKNQGGCGSCWDFAAVGAMEAQYQIGVGNPSTGVDLSEQNVLSCSGGSCSGWYIDQALAFLYTSGTPDEACNPYAGTDSPCGSGRCSDYLSRTYRITGWSSIPTDTTTIKNYLYTHGPVIVAMAVFDNFPWYDANFWQYYFYSHSPSGNYQGHAVVIVGWDDQGAGTADDYWIVRNSWGTSGGDVNNNYGGYFYMTQDPTTGFFGVYNEAYSISGVTAPPPVTITVTSRSTTNPTSYLSMTTTSTVTSYTSTYTSTSTIPTVTTIVLLQSTVTSIVQSFQYLTSILTTAVTSCTGTVTSTSTIPTTVALVQSTLVSSGQNTEYLTLTRTTTVTSYTGTEGSTSTVVVPTTVVLVPFTTTSTAQTTQFLTSTSATTVTDYTSTESSTSTILVPTTIVLVPLTATSTVQSTHLLSSIVTTTVTSYTATTTSTSASVVHTTVTSLASAGESNPLVCAGFISLLAVAVGRVTAGKGRRIEKVGSRMRRRCSRS